MKRSPTLIRAMALVSALTAVVVAGCSGPAKPTTPAFERPLSTTWLPPFAAKATGGMVASVHPLATDAGVAAFKNGGNAIDAAIATALTLGVVDGHNSGIGGGCFILIRFADGTFMAIDGRETAPAKATRDMYLRDGKGDTKLSQTGPLAPGTPGALAAYAEALRAGGKLPLAAALEPGAQLADHGFPIDDRYAAKLKAQAKTLAQFTGSAAVLIKPDGTNYLQGDTLVQKDLAATYRGIAATGTDHFYKGPVAAAVGAWMADNGGILSAEDFAAYQPKKREPLVTTYRGYTVVGFPPPSSGGVHVAQILNTIEPFPIGTVPEPDRVHIITEAMKLAFADRAYYLGDPDFVPVPKGLIDKAYGLELSSKINLTRATTVPSQGTPPRLDQELFGKHTTHIAAADAEGNWVAITQTVNTAFGSKVIVPGTGVILNNEMDDFSIQPGVANAFKLIGSENNAVAPGKRPLSSMSPTIVLKDGQPVMTVGAAGGPTIITQALLAVSNVIDLGDDIPAALARPRYHHQWSPKTVWVERKMPLETREELAKRGHDVELIYPPGTAPSTRYTQSAGASQAILRTADGYFVGVSEPRLRGKAAGVDK